MKSIFSFLLLFAPLVLVAEAALLRVLILCDSIYREPAKSISSELKGRAEIVHAIATSNQLLHSSISPEQLNLLLGSGKWDLIHFNFGLGDLLYRMPGISSVRVMPKEAGGVRHTSPEQYEKNLQAIVTRLKATGAKLVWASTTPISGSANNVFEVGSEIESNAIAAKIMAKERIPTNDMHAYVMSQRSLIPARGRSNDPFTFERNHFLHPPVVEVIRSHLNLR